MKSISSLSSSRAYALVTVLLFTALLLTLSAGLLSWSATEARVDSSHKRRLIARNSAEAVLEYGTAQTALRVHQATDFDAAMFDPSNNKSPLTLPDSSLFAGTNIDPGLLEVVGKVIPPPATGRFDIDDKDPNNGYSTLRGSGRAGQIEILARATTFPDNFGKRESYYLMKTVTVLDTPVFQYAAFYNTDFEASPGPDLNIYGPVHTNGDFWVSKQSSGDLSFWDKVTAVGKVRKGLKVQPVKSNGDREKSGDGNIKFMTPNKTLENLYSQGIWRDIYMGGSTENPDKFLEFTSATYGAPPGDAFLQSSANKLERRPLPGQLDNYVPDPDPTDGIIDPKYRNVPRALIERPLESGDAEYLGIEVEKQKMSRKAGLYIAVNASGQDIPQGRVKDPAGNVIAGGFQKNEYRAWVRNPSNGSYIEVQLPGEPGHTATARAARPIITVRLNQMIDMRRYNELSTTNPIGYDWFKPRSAANSYQPKLINVIDVDLTALKKAVEFTVNGATSTMIFPYDSEVPGNPGYFSTYRAVHGTINGSFVNEYGVHATNSRGVLREGNPDLTRDDYIEGMDDPKYWDGSIYIESIEDDFLSTATVTTSSPAPVMVNGETSNYPTRRNYGPRKSGVRLINGRGPIVSANSRRLGDRTYACSPGLTLTTNDPLYILGHLNADGVIIPSKLPASNPLQSQLNDYHTTDSATSGNNSSLYPDPRIIAGAPEEPPLALVADAITILSQPTFAPNLGAQTGGWCDHLSYLAISTGNHTSDWYSKPPSAANQKDGAIATDLTEIQPPDGTPFDALSPDLFDATRTLKPPASWEAVKCYRATKWLSSKTEIAAGFIVGVTPSAKHPTDSSKDGQQSGGIHNLPRFLEAWADDVNTQDKDDTCAIRGSMVVMFDSQVAWEPWSLRVYDPPTRFWGFNNLFHNYIFSDDIPATRNIGSTGRDSYKRLTKDQYISERAKLWPDYSFPTPP